MPSTGHVALAASRDVRQLPWRPPVQAAAGRAPQPDIRLEHRANMRDARLRPASSVLQPDPRRCMITGTFFTAHLAIDAGFDEPAREVVAE